MHILVLDEQWLRKGDRMILDRDLITVKLLHISLDCLLYNICFCNIEASGTKS